MNKKTGSQNFMLTEERLKALLQYCMEKNPAGLKFWANISGQSIACSLKAGEHSIAGVNVPNSGLFSFVVEHKNGERFEYRLPDNVASFKGWYAKALMEMDAGGIPTSMKDTILRRQEIAKIPA